MQRWRRVLIRSLLTAILLVYVISLMVLSFLPTVGLPDSLHKLKDKTVVEGHLMGKLSSGDKINVGRRHLPTSPSKTGNVKEGGKREPEGDVSDTGHPYRLLINQPLVCSANEDMPQGPFLLVLVHSHFLHVTRRHAIRDTWGRIRHNYDTPQHVTILFLLGTSNDTQENEAVYKEAKLYRDILQWDFQDGYHNLTMKSIMSFKWSQKYCPEVPFILKTDDDVYLNMTSVLSYLVHNSSRMLFVGHVNFESHVMRIGQWGVTNDDYPLSTYPPYCSGAAYVMSWETICALYKTLPETLDNMFPVEDVYITGFLPQRLDLTCNHSDAFPTWTTLIRPDTVFSLIQGDLFGIHGVSYERMYSLWKVKHDCPNCAKYKLAVEDWLTQEFQYLSYYENIEDGYTEV